MHSDLATSSLQSPAAAAATELSFWRLMRAGLLAGLGGAGAGALFLPLLAAVTRWREATPALVAGLPLAGFAIGTFTSRYAREGLGGSALVLRTFHLGGPALPWFFAPIVLVGTLLTHLFGGSAGREGTGVQMGAALADGWARRLAVSPSERQIWLQAGVAAGFASVFGTPLAAIAFAEEFFGGGAGPRRRLLATSVAALLGHFGALALGCVHTAYPRPTALAFTLGLAGKWLLFALACAVSSRAAVGAIHAARTAATRIAPPLSLRMALGGLSLCLLVGCGLSPSVLGLGLETIVAACGGAPLDALLGPAKALATALTVGTGFLGGEVTPLFFMGAMLGHVVAGPLGLPPSLAAATGMSALFAGAANAPCAMVLMAYELFGSAAIGHAAIVCTATCLLGGRGRLYAGQALHPLLQTRPAKALAQATQWTTLRGLLFKQR